jgi:hypothetical protein
MATARGAGRMRGRSRSSDGVLRRKRCLRRIAPNDDTSQVHNDDEYPGNLHDPRPNVCRRAERLPSRMGGVRARSHDREPE